MITIGGIPLSEEDSTASGDQKNTITNNENNTTTSPEIDTKTETKSQNNQSTIAPVNFQIFYGYNEKGISSEQEKFNAFIDGINEIITINGKVQIELEGSASSVPTKSYNSNKNLANQRTINAKQFLSDRLVKLGVDISKFKIVSENSLVQGPKYIGDYLNKEKYAKYQYIKITAF